MKTYKTWSNPFSRILREMVLGENLRSQLLNRGVSFLVHHPSYTEWIRQTKGMRLHQVQRRISREISRGLPLCQP